MAQSLWSADGSSLFSPKLGKTMYEQAAPDFIYRQFCQVEDAFGKGNGDAFQFTKTLRIDTRGGTLVETTTMPSNRIKFVKDSITVTEYGNGVQYTEKLETLSTFDMRGQYGKGLTQDYRDVVDRDIYGKFTSAKFKAVCTNTATTIFTTNGTATITATANPSDKNIRDIVNYLKKKHTPGVGGGLDYLGVLSVEAKGGLFTYLQAINQYTTPSKAMNREIGKYYNVRFSEDANAANNAIGSSTAFGEGFIFGDEAVLEAVATPEELRFEQTDLGRSKKLAWFGIFGWKKMWDLANDDSNSTGNGIERIVHITSA